MAGPFFMTKLFLIAFITAVTLTDPAPDLDPLCHALMRNDLDTALALLKHGVRASPCVNDYIEREWRADQPLLISSRRR